MGGFRTMLPKGSIIEIREHFTEKPAMRGPFSVHTAMRPETGEKTLFPAPSGTVRIRLVS